MKRNASDLYPSTAFRSVDEKASQFQVGKLVEGTITRLTKFGAFARLTDDIEGLIHISEISERRIEHPKEVLQEGDVCTCVHQGGSECAPHRSQLRRVDSMAYADMDWQTLKAFSLRRTNQTVDQVEEPSKVKKPPDGRSCQG